MVRPGIGLLCVLALAACSEPFITIPGGKLAGQSLDPPVEWSEVPGTIQMEMRPADPYSINIWSVGVGSDLYVATSADGTTWTGFLEADNSVRVRLQDVIYTLKASESAQYGGTRPGRACLRAKNTKSTRVTAGSYRA